MSIKEHSYVNNETKSEQENEKQSTDNKCNHSSFCSKIKELEELATEYAKNNRLGVSISRHFGVYNADDFTIHFIDKFEADHKTIDDVISHLKVMLKKNQNV